MKPALCFTLLVAACAHNVDPPPARTLPLDTPATLAPGRVALGFSAGGGGVELSDTIVTGTGSVSYGLADRIEVSAEASVAHDNDNSPAGTNTNGWAARAGVKWSILPRYLAVVGGVGFGGWAGGPFFAFDGGVVGGYENCYVVPFVALRGGASVPLDAREVDTGTGDAMPGEFVASPTFTGNMSEQFGLKVPLAERCGEQADVELYGVVQFIQLYNTRGQSDGGGELGGGVRFTF